jgi:hypothetical protein
LFASFASAIGTSAATPTFSPAAGSYIGTQTVTINDATVGATVYYTTNGTAPTTSSTVYSSPLTVSATETVEAMATASGLSNSSVATAIYTILVPATLTSPTPGNTLSGASQAFTWSPGNIATHFELWVGTTGVGSSNVYNSGNVTVTTEAVNGIPTNGQPVYVRLYSLINGTWQSNDYTFTAYGSPTLATMISPTQGSTLSGASQGFTWNPGNLATHFELWVGTTGVGSANVYNSGNVTVTTENVNGIPTNGQPVYVRLYSLINGTWQPNDYTYTAYGSPIAAQLISPPPGSVLPGGGSGPASKPLYAAGGVTFVWTPGNIATHFELWLGSTGVGSSNLYNSGNVTVTTETVTGLPTNGETIYARLYSLINGTWQSADYTYTASGSPTLAMMTSPAQGGTLAGTSQLFTWSPGNTATHFELWVGTTGVGSSNLYNSGNVTVTSESVNNLPSNGETVYARLYSLINGTWQSNDYTYTASGSPTLAAMSTPIPGSTLSGSSVSFTWSPGNTATHFELWLGSTGVGSSNLYNSGNVTVTTETVNSLPTNGEKIYARLYSLINGTWQSADYTYTASSTQPLTLPAAGPLTAAVVGQSYNNTVSLTASGGVGPNYTFTVNGATLTTGGVQIADGLGAIVPTSGSNILWFGGTPVSVTPAGNPVSFTVAVTDSASNTVGPYTYTIAVVPPQGNAVSGTVTYTGLKTGWIYLKLIPSSKNAPTNAYQGTAIPAPGPFTIYGVPPGAYTVQAFLDNLGYGAENASNPTSPTGNSAVSVTVTSGPVSAGTVPLTDPAPVTLGSATPTWNGGSGSGGFSGGAFVSFNTITNNNGIEMPAAYTVQWNTSSSFNGSGGSTCFPATGSQQPWIVSGIAGSDPYYFRAAGMVGNCGSSTAGLIWSAPSGPITIAAPSSGNLVQGTVTFAGTATGPLYVGFYDMSTGNIYATVVGSQANPPLSGVSYSVYVPTGSNYFNFGIIDQNNDGLMVPGSISNVNLNQMTPVAINPSIPSTLTQNLALPSNAAGTAPLNSISYAWTTNLQQTNLSGYTYSGTSVDLRLYGLYKLPVAVQLSSGPNYVTFPANFPAGAFDGYNDEFDYWPNTNGAMPSTSDVYTLKTTYSDSTSDSQNVSPTGVVTSFATGLTPTWNTAGVSTTPTFTWNYPSGESNYTYQFLLVDSNFNTIWQIPGQHSGSSTFAYSQLPSASITWGIDPTGGGSLPSVPSLSGNSQYSWQIQVYDSYGNIAQRQVSFETPEPALTLPSSGTVYTAVGQPFLQSLNVSGGSGSGYVFTVNSSSGTTISGVTTWTLADGLTASSTVGSNLLTVSGTPTLAQIVPLSVSAQDGVSDTVGPVSYYIDVYNQGSGTTATGNVSYGGSKTGWVYLSLVPTNNCNYTGCYNPNPGTAISAATLASGGAFTIHGVQPGAYQLNAWMDALGYGVENVADPMGSTSVTVTGSTLSGVSVTLYDPGTVTLSSAPTWDNSMGVGAFSGGAMVYFDSILNNNGVQIPTSYILEYSTDSTFNTGVSSMSFPAAHADHHWIVTGLTNDATYYFRAAGVMGSGNSAVIGPWSPASPSGGLTIGAPSGPNTIQGTVTFSGKATGPLYVGLIDVGLGNYNIFAEAIQNPVSPQPYSIQVPSGSEFVLFGIIDQNNDGWNSPGDISNFGGNGLPPVYVNGSMSGVNLTLPSTNSIAVLDTENWGEADEYYTGGGYNLFTLVSAASKLPVAAELLSGPNVIAPEDLAVCGTCSLLDRLYSTFTPSSTPTVGDPYKFQVNYSDGSSETLNLAVTGVVPLLSNLAPTGIGGTSTTPTFTWTDPANASNYDYQFLVYDQNFNTLWEVPHNFTGLSGFPSSITSITWGSDPTGANNPPSVSSLTSDEVYYWQVGATDVNGNWSQTEVDYVPSYTPLALPPPNPGTLGAATLDQPYTGSIVVTGGYAPYYWSVNGCAFNCNDVSLGKGLTASNSGIGNNTLTISGTPNATGSVTLTAYVYDSTFNTPTTTYTYTINITEKALALTSGGQTVYAFVNQPFSQLYTASGGSGSGYTFMVNGQSVPTNGSSVTLTNGDNLTAAMSSANTLNISGTPTAIQNISLAINLVDSQSHSITPTFYVDVVAQPSGANNGNLYGTYVCKVDGFHDSDGARWASLASFQADGSGNLTNGVWDTNSRDFMTAMSGTMTGTYSIGADNNGEINMSGTVTSGGTGSYTNTWAIALSNAGEPTSPAQEFRMVEIDDVGTSASGQHSTADCYLASTGAFAASTIGSNGFAFGFQGEDDSGNPKAYVGRFTAVAGSSGGTISTGIFDGMAVNQSGDEGASITSGTYTAPDANTGRFTLSFTAGGYTSDFAVYIIDANRMFLLSIDAASGNGIVDGDVRTQQQSSYSGANLGGNFVLYYQGYGYENGSIAGYGSSVFQGTGDGKGNFTINQSYDDNNGSYASGHENGGPIAANFDSSNPGRISFSPGNGMIYMYLFNNNNAFFLMLNGGSPSSLDTGWVEPQSQTTFTDAALAGTYLYGRMPLIEPSVSGSVGEYAFDSAGDITGDTTTAGPGNFTWDSAFSYQQLNSQGYSWLSATYGTFQITQPGPSLRSCAVISATRAACINNTTPTPLVIILQQ